MILHRKTASKTIGDEHLPAEKRYAHIAEALARGYTDLYYVNIETDEFIEYHTDEKKGVLREARRGNDFFPGCARDAKKFVHKDDQKLFIETMTRDFLENALKDCRTYEFSYRRIIGKRTFYVRMVVTKMEDDPKFLVIAVSDIDELVKKRQEEAMIQEERTIYARLHALTGNFICVYVIDPVTDRYREFSATKEYEGSFSQAKAGEDFFNVVRKVGAEFNHPEDLPHFLSSFTKENILASIERDGLFVLVYRLLVDGKPRYVQMNGAMVEEKEGKRLIIGLNDIDAQYQQQEKAREIARQKDILGQITRSLTEQYDVLYYIEIDSCSYTEISSTDDYDKLNVPTAGSDFFAESRRNIRRYVHPEDQEKAIGIHYKDTMLENLKGRHSFSMSWRLVAEGKVKHIRYTALLAKDGAHIIVCIKNIDAEVAAERAMEEDKRRSVTYTQIAERLADHYDFIYYIDCETTSYIELSAKQKYGEIHINAEGEDFFGTSRKNAELLIYAEDRERIVLFLDRDNLISKLENRGRLTEDYRMVLDGKIQFTRMSVTYSSDRTHFIICVENRDEGVRREKERIESINLANEMARRDELTHTKNKTAFNEIKKELQKEMDEGKGSFGLAICDINDLKAINDTEGHMAGDVYIKSACSLICRVFPHCPVYRIGGDEFVVLLQEDSLKESDSLLFAFRKQVEENLRLNEGPVVASGLALCRKGEDETVDDVFKRADEEMYANKAYLKEQKLLQESRSFKEEANVRVIDEERRKKVDTLFKAFDIVAEGTYIYLCDMKYNFSRWSKSAVDKFGLPSEYMYGAGDIWEERIHPDDRAAYHQGIDEIFSGIASGHDMQYRAKTVEGEYDVCTCRGIVLRDVSGEPDYFVGTIRDHGIQGHIDTLTGLRNQYGFFEDLNGFIKRNAEVRIVLLGISRFSEFNEMYGYHFGNRVLQQFARALYKRVGNTGHTYRIDGTKFAVISNTLNMEEVKKDYDEFRQLLHEDFTVDKKHVMLDLHCGAIAVDRFDVDSQTIYACLNYADEESKAKQRGDMVEFSSNQDEASQQKVEMMHEIRHSIMHGCEGFYLLYQPVVDAKTEHLIGAEALLRWKSERFGGVIPPDKFIPIIESDSLFPELGEWIIREALSSAKLMLHQNPRFVINVNLSYSQIEKPDFVDMVVETLKSMEFPPDHLCLEVTERCRLLDLNLLTNVVIRLKAMGVIVALDDFGTGFSSIGILKDIPVNIIKVDRSFVQAIEVSEIDRELVHHIAGVADIFHAKVCVEGVENKGMRNILRGLRVNSFQGYYYAKPLPFDELLTWKKP